MKFSEMPYERPNVEALKKEAEELTSSLLSAPDYETAKDAFLSFDTFSRHVSTLAELAGIRHSIDTRDEFYSAERQFWDDVQPSLEESTQAFNKTLLESPFRSQFEAEYGELMFLNTEIETKAFSPEIIPMMQEENSLVTEYEKILASAQIDFEGEKRTLSRMSPFKSNADDDLRLSAWKAEGSWYKEHSDELDSLYDRLVHLRDEMGRKLGYDGYLKLGYYRMMRNCYDENDVERFREAVRTYVVPLADEIYRMQAERTGLHYPLSYADAALEFRDGNPRPVGSADDIVSHASTFYDELSPETSEFFRLMRDMELMDLLSTDGKEGGGYCTSIPDYGVPFIFANFNGTQHDVEVVTHEAGHAFAAWMNADRIPMSQVWPGMEACEVHSMSMEFLAWPWEEGFFGKDTDKFKLSHLAGALTFIPYGTMVDDFQHRVYKQPDMTPAERHAVWRELTGIYMPWIRLDGEIPFYAEGMAWQRQSHIYSSPLYYIDYCLAQTVALEIWSIMQKDRKDAWNHYMEYTKQGGSRTFKDLLSHAGLHNPFDETCLRDICLTARNWLDAHFVKKAVHRL